MPLDRDTDTEIVIRLFWGLRASGGFFMLAGIGWFVVGLAGLAGGLGAENAEDRFAGGGGATTLGVALFLFGTWFAQMTTKITFNQPPGLVTMGWRTWARWPPFTRTKHISKEEVARVDIRSVQGTDWRDRPRTTYQVWLEMNSGEEVILLHYPDDRKVAERLEERILEFSPAAVPR